MIGKHITLAAAKQLSDWEVIQKVLGGEQTFLEILYERYAGHIYHKCLSITKNKETSQDLSHDILIKIFTNLSKFKGTSDFSFWVHSITYNYCMDYLKRQKRLRFEEFDAAAFEHIAADEIEREHKILKEMQFEQLETLFEELKGADKMILLMRYQDGMSVKQIAASLKLGESAVKMRLKRSRARLAQLLKNAEDEEA